MISLVSRSSSSSSIFKFHLQVPSSSSIFVQLTILARFITIALIFPSFNFDFSIFLTFLIGSFFILAFMLYTVGLQDSKLLVSTFLNILHHLSIRHIYSYTFNLFSSLPDQHKLSISQTPF